MYLGFQLLCYFISFIDVHLWSELSSSAILHHERVNKNFGKHSTRLLTTFSKFVITTRLPLHWVSVNRRHLQRTVIQIERRLHNSTVVEEEESSYVLFSLIMSYMLILVIYISMVLLDLLKCMVVIDVTLIVLLFWSATYYSCSWFIFELK
jgi:hypothetical protein